jgi:hypothetical protein
MKTVVNEIRVCELTAENNNIKCLKYYHKNGCLLNEALCQYAAKIENIDLLKYAHKNGCM